MKSYLPAALALALPLAVAAAPMKELPPKPTVGDIVKSSKATEWRLYDHKANTGHKLFLAPNPPEGALLTYWLPLWSRKFPAPASTTPAAAQSDANALSAG